VTIEAENKAEGKKAMKEFAKKFEIKWLKAVAKIAQDEEVLLAYYSYSAELFGRA